MAEPSIAMIPSGYKAEKIYSVLPTNGNADLDFARNSKSTRINEQGLIEEMAVNVPILDYSDGTCPSLKLQPQSTNLIPYSESFGNSYWVKKRCTIDGGGHISPSGESNAFKMTATADDARLQDGSESVGVVYNQSIYVKSATGSDVSGQLDFTGAQIQTFTATDQWQRVTTTSDNTRSGVVRVRITNSGDELYIWGAQLEQLSYATSYIKTEGSTQTRLQDTASKSGLENEINSEEGTFYAEISALSNDGTLRRMSISDGTSSNRLYFQFDSVSNRIYCSLVVGGVSQVDLLYVTSDLLTLNKIAFSFKENDFKLFIDGVLRGSDTSGSVWSANTLNRLAFDDGNGANIMSSKTKDLRVYKIALTNAQLTTLTTI